MSDMAILQLLAPIAAIPGVVLLFRYGSQWVDSDIESFRLRQQVRMVRPSFSRSTYFFNGTEL